MRAVIFVLADPGFHTNLWDARLDIPRAPLMDENDILELHQMGFEIGSHSLSHPRLPSLSREKAWEEISRSRIRLEISLNAPVRTFAYPYGLLNPTLKEMVAAAGYSHACSVWSGPAGFATDPFEIRRIEVNHTTGIPEFALKVLGPYPSYRSLRSQTRLFITGRNNPVHASQVKTLLLVSAGLNWPDRNGFAERDAEDRHPRGLPLLESLNADVADERFLQSAPRWRRAVYRATGTVLAQVLEAYSVRHHYDVIVSWAEQLGLPLAALSRFGGARTPHVSIFSWISRPKKAHLLRMVHPAIDRIIFMSSAQQKFAVERLRIPRSRTVLLRWPVDEKFWRPLGGPQDMICSVGREMRDYATLIEALRGTEIPCHIATGGQLDIGKQDRWMKDVGENSSLPPNVTTGGKSFAALRELYDRSRFVVIPLHETDTDNGTTSILEAMAMGKAVICSRVRGQTDVIKEGVTGFFVPPGDSQALREAIRALWADPERARNMGRMGREHILQFHALDDWVKDVRCVIDDVLRERLRHRTASPRRTPESREAAEENAAIQLVHTAGEREQTNV